MLFSSGIVAGLLTSSSNSLLEKSLMVLDLKTLVANQEIKRPENLVLSKLFYCCVT